MTNRLKSLIVAFEHDIREDDAQCIIDAILMIKGIAGVSKEVTTSVDWINRCQIKREFSILSLVCFSWLASIKGI